MRHITPAGLDRLEPLLTELRAVGPGLGLVEKKRGVFYKRSKAFLHFHEDGDDLFADIRLVEGGLFERQRVTTAAERRALVAAVRAASPVGPG